jgi:hypothetical protein
MNVANLFYLSVSMGTVLARTPCWLPARAKRRSSAVTLRIDFANRTRCQRPGCSSTPGRANMIFVSTSPQFGTGQPQLICMIETLASGPRFKVARTSSASSRLGSTVEPSLRRYVKATDLSPSSGPLAWNVAGGGDPAPPHHICFHQGHVFDQLDRAPWRACTLLRIMSM